MTVRCENAEMDLGAAQGCEYWGIGMNISEKDGKRNSHRKRLYVYHDIACLIHDDEPVQRSKEGCVINCDAY